MVLTKDVKHKLASLTSNEREALDEIVTRLHRHYGDDLLRVVLFGSKSRGDFDEESDLDLLIVLRMPGGDYWRHWDEIVDLVWDVEFSYGIVTSLIIKDEHEFNTIYDHGLLLYRNIQQDGIMLWMKQPGALTFERSPLPTPAQQYIARISGIFG